MYTEENTIYFNSPIVFSMLFTLLILLYSPLSFALTSLQTSVDKNPIMSNEAVVLTVIADDSVDSEQLDTTNLLQDFIIVRSSVSSQTSMVNFTTSRTTRWTIVLMPRRSGDLTIGSLSVDNIKSTPIALTVIDINSAQAKNTNQVQQDIFLTAKTLANEVYVQQLVTLKVKLHIAVNLQRASLTEPNFENATIEAIGEDIKSEEIINGKRYQTVERSYAITPEKSGDYTLVTPSFSGEVLQQSRRRSSFFNMNDAKPVHIVGENIQITVLPVPDVYPSDTHAWLPSEMLSLHQEWQPKADHFVVGEPITRTITLTAAGISKEQLPAIEMPMPKGIKVYPDQAQNNSRATSNRLVSQKKQNFALVVNRPGQYTLPAIQIAWWNTVTNKAEIATLPARTITVKENTDELLSNNSTPSSDKLTSNNTKGIDGSSSITANVNNNGETPAIGNPLQINPPLESANQSSFLQWLFLSLWLITLLAWFLHVYVINKKIELLNLSDNNLPNSSLPNNAFDKKTLGENASGNIFKGFNHRSNRYHLKLLAACKQNNSKEALSLILPWFNAFKDKDSVKVTTLEQVIEIINEASFSLAVNDLQQSLYGKVENNDETDMPKNSWSGSDLATAVQRFQSHGNEKQNTSKIALNP